VGPACTIGVAWRIAGGWETEMAGAAFTGWETASGNAVAGMSGDAGFAGSRCCWFPSTVTWEVVAVSLVLGRAGSVSFKGMGVHCPRAGPGPLGPRVGPGPALKGQGQGQLFWRGSALGQPWPYSISNIVRKYLKLH